MKYRTLPNTEITVSDVGFGDDFGAGPEQGRFKGTMSPPDDAVVSAHA